MDFNKDILFLKKIINGELNHSETLDAANPDSLAFDFRHIGTIRDEFKNQMPDAIWKLLQARRQRLQQGLGGCEPERFMYPFIAEEFSLETDFLRHAFPLPSFPKLKGGKNLKFLTIGSCFARNITTSLKEKGFTSSNSHFPENINSPIALLSLLYCLPDHKKHLAYAQSELLKIISENPSIGNKNSIKEYIELENMRFQSLHENLDLADCVIITLGNTLEWKNSFDKKSNEIVNLHPLYAMQCLHHNLPGVPTVRFKSIRQQSPHSITLKALELIIENLRRLTSAPVICTVSPIPINGISNKNNASFYKSAISENNLSKSILRSALHEAVEANSDRFYYFPSYEIATEVVLRMPGIVFGGDDSYSRHLDKRIVDSACDFFLKKCFGDI